MGGGTIDKVKKEPLKREPAVKNNWQTDKMISLEEMRIRRLIYFGVYN